MWKTRVASGVLSGTPGQMILQKKRLMIACGEGSVLEAIEVQVEGRKRMPAEAFLNGQQLTNDEILGVKAA